MSSRPHDETSRPSHLPGPGPDLEPDDRRAAPLVLRIEVLVGAMAAVSVAFLASLAAFGRQPAFIQSDGLGYYAWVRSVVFDGDVDFSNELAMAGGDLFRNSSVATTPRGTPVNKYSVGLAVIESPAVIATRTVERLAGVEPTSRPGYSLWYQGSVALSLLGSGFLLIYAVFRRLQGGDPAGVGLLALGALGATNLIEYVTRSVSSTHLTDIALVSAVWLLASQVTPPRPRRYVAIGALLGLASIVRYTNVLVFPWLLAGLFLTPHPPRVRDAAWLALGSFVPVSIQAWANLALWGTVAGNPYPGERFNWTSPHLWSSLFSVERGWLLWHPWFLVLVALTALSWLHYRRSAGGRAFLAAAVFAVLALWYVNSAWWNWRFGFGFGHRGYLVLLPVLTITVAQAWPTLRAHVPRALGGRRGRALAVTVVSALVLWNANLWTGFILSAVTSGVFQPSYEASALWALRHLTGNQP